MHRDYRQRARVALAALFVALLGAGAFASPAQASEQQAKPTPGIIDWNIQDPPRPTTGMVKTPASKLKAVNKAATPSHLGKAEPKAGTITTLAACGTPPCYNYVGARQDFTGTLPTSVNGNVRVKKPYLNTVNDSHSLQEFALLNPGTGSTRNIAEIGWTVDPAVCGSLANSPCLFTYHWVLGVPQGYNATATWMQNGSCAFTPGMNLTSDISNTSASSQMNIVVDDASSPAADGLWFYYKNTAGVGCYMGYYPASDWTSQGTSFTSGTRIDTFMEVSSGGTSPTTTPCTDFGSGDPSSVGGTSAGYFGSVTANPMGGAGTSLTGYANPTVTNANIKSWTFATGSTRTFWAGGYGWNAAGTGQGVKGGC
jgi:hypothetical protein